MVIAKGKATKRNIAGMGFIGGMLRCDSLDLGVTPRKPVAICETATGGSGGLVKQFGSIATEVLAFDDGAEVAELTMCMVELIPEFAHVCSALFP